MQRRDFIYLSAFTAVALAVPVATGCKSRQADVESQPFFFSHLADAKTIVNTGNAYRKRHPEEDDKSKLVNLLLADSVLPSSSDTEAIRKMLMKKVHDDFKNGHTAIAAGWVLSLTEARQCALFSILQA